MTSKNPLYIGCGYTSTFNGVAALPAQSLSMAKSEMVPLIMTVQRRVIADGRLLCKTSAQRTVGNSNQRHRTFSKRKS